MLYAYTTILKGDEQNFWKSTPRKIFNLLDVHYQVNKVDTKENKKRDTGSYKNKNNGTYEEVKTYRVLD